MKTMSWQEQGHYMPYEFDESTVDRFRDRPIQPLKPRCRALRRQAVPQSRSFWASYDHALAVLAIIAIVVVAIYATGNHVEPYRP